MYPQNLFQTDPYALLQFFLAAGVALAAAAPIGAVSILTIQRAMSLGFKRAFLPALGAVAGDGVYGVIAAFGSGYLTDSIAGSRVWFRLAGCLILVIVGLRLVRHGQAHGSIAGESFGLMQLGLLKFTLVLSNPLTLGFYLAAFAMLGLRSPHLFAPQSFVLGSGIAAGALVWFSLICAAAGRFHLKVGDLHLNRMRRAVGALFVILGLVTAATVLIRG